MTWSRDAVRWAAKVEPPATARTAAQRHLLDGLGCALAAVHRDAAPYVASVVAGAVAPEEATVIGMGLRRPRHVAAFANGILVHSLDFDDTHAGGLVHATAVLLPVVLAEGEHVGADGRAAVDAAVAGYELLTRLAMAVPHGFHRRGLHATSVVGVLAAAAAAARLRGCDEDTAVSAVGIAGSMASGSLAFLADGAATKQLHPGWAASAAIQAVTLAEAGATGPEAVLEDPERGFYRAYADGVPDDPFATLDERWEVEQITIKPYPSCQLMHASLDALQALVDRHRLPADRVASIRFALPSEAAEIVCRPTTASRPRTPYDAKFSLPWCAAALLHDGTVTVSTFDRLDRPELDALVDRVRFEVVDSAVPAAAAPGAVEVLTSDGVCLAHEVAGSKGGPGNPLTDRELIDKAVTNSGVTGLPDAVLGLVTAPDLAEVLSCIRR